MNALADWVLRLQLGLHRLLQRGFARLYSYTDKPHGDGEQDLSDRPEILMDQLMGQCESSKDLHYKMKGASILTLFESRAKFSGRDAC